MRKTLAFFEHDFVLSNSREKEDLVQQNSEIRQKLQVKVNSLTFREFTTFK